MRKTRRRTRDPPRTSPSSKHTARARTVSTNRIARARVCECLVNAAAVRYNKTRLNRRRVRILDARRHHTTAVFGNEWARRRKKNEQK